MRAERLIVYGTVGVGGPTRVMPGVRRLISRIAHPRAVSRGTKPKRRIARIPLRHLAPLSAFAPIARRRREGVAAPMTNLRGIGAATFCLVRRS